MLFLLMSKYYSQLTHTSALYILIKPELTLSHVFTELIPHNTLECSAKGPVFILKEVKYKQYALYNNYINFKINY